MITSVLAKNLKGLSFEHALYPKTIIIGPNGAGKSAIIQAIMLAIEGSVPNIAKKNESILDAVGCASGPLYVEATMGKTQIGRKYEADKNGVKQTLMVDRRKADQRAFFVALDECKAPRIVAVDDFLSMSSKKMVAFLAGKVGGEELEIIATNIEKSKADLSHWQGKLKESEAYVSKLAGNIAKLDLPSGTMAEIQAEIKSKQKELGAAKTQLAELDSQEKAEADRLKAEEKQLETARAAFAAGAASAAQQSLETVSPGPELPLHYPAGLPPEGEVVETFPAMSTHSPDLGEPGYRAPLTKPPQLCAQAADSIQLIIDQIRAVDCPTCKGGTALMVALRELRTWRENS